MKPAPGDPEELSATSYAKPERRSMVKDNLPCQQPPGADVSLRPSTTVMTTAEDPVGNTPPAAVAHSATVPTTSVASVGNERLVGLPNPRLSGILRLQEDTFPRVQSER